MSLKKVVEMIEKGSCVVLRSDEDPRVQVYHKNPEDKSLVNFITLNGYSASLLNEGEWDWYLSSWKYKSKSNSPSSLNSVIVECRRTHLTEEEIKSFNKCDYYNMAA